MGPSGLLLCPFWNTPSDRTFAQSHAQTTHNEIVILAVENEDAVKSEIYGGMAFNNVSKTVG